MKKNLLFILLPLFILNCKNENNENQKEVSLIEKSKKKSTVALDIQSLPFDIVDFDGLKPYLNKKDNKTYVINFWATWCAPCVKELPYFEQLNKNYASKNVEVILVSLDFPKQYEKKLVPFIKDKNIQSKVIALNDMDQDRWINGINKDWDGAIPVTLIYNKNKSAFYEQTFTYKTLENEVKTFLN